MSNLNLYTTPIENYFMAVDTVAGLEIPCHQPSPEETKVKSPSNGINNKYIRECLMKIKDKGIEISPTFRPELRLRFKPSTITALLNEYFKKKSHRHQFSLVLVGEYSLTGIYHMHGILDCEPRFASILRREMPREFGRTELKTISYPDSYVDYILKDEKKAKPTEKVVLSEETIIINST